MSELMIVKCPTCSKPVIWSNESQHRPFCCKRCQLIDLGEWANEEKRISRSVDSSYSDVCSKYLNKQVSKLSY